jgi:sarcosine oxidase subunit alpha
MPESVEIVVDGERLHVSEGMTLASALVDAGVDAFRDSVSGTPRAPICGMGSCFECRVTVNGRPQQRSCLIPCTEGMIVETANGRSS